MVTEVKCLICGEDAYELQLCNDHFTEHIAWKQWYGYGSEHRVEQWLSEREHMASAEVQREIDALLSTDPAAFVTGFTQTEGQ